MKKIRAGLIGYGYWGPNIARILNDSPNAEFVYCADLSDDSLKLVRQSYPFIKVTKNYKEILGDKSIDAVFIVTPTKTHYQLARDSLLSRKHVFVEKPLTNESKTCEKLIAIAKKTERLLAVGHLFLFNPAVKYIKNVINKNELGTIRYLHFQRRNLGPVRKDVNVLWDLSPHDISMLLYFIKEKPLTVFATGQSYLQKGIEDIISANIKFENKIMATLIYSWIDPIKIRDITIVGDKKMLSFNDVNASEKIKIFDRNANIINDTRGVSFGEYQIALHAGDISIPSIKNKEPLKEEINHFLQCVLKNVLPINDGINGLQVIEVIEALQKSLDKNSIQLL